MAERFPSRSFLSVIAGEKPPKSNKGQKRSPGRPPQKDTGRGKGNPPVAPELENRHVRGKSNPSSKIEYLQSLSADISNGKPRPGTPTPRPRKPANSPPKGDARKRKPQESAMSPADVRRTVSKPRNLSDVPPPRTRPAKRTRRRTTSPLVYATRLLILGMGIAVISGTALSVLNSFGQSMAGGSHEQKNKGVDGQKSKIELTSAPMPRLALTQELVGLKKQIQALATQNTSLMPAVFLADLDSGGFVSFNGETVFAAASTIKVPILVAFFQAVDEGRVHLDQKMTLRKEHIVGGSGEMQLQKPGREYTALEVATKMIVVSDNTATNMLIELLGGKEALNQRFLMWGLKGTSLHNLLPDLEGTNLTNPRDLVNLMAQIHQGNLVSMKSRDRIFHIMEKTENDTLLPKGLGEGATIAHKTGTLDSILADVGMVDMLNGKRYLIGVMVKHSKNDTGADQLIRDISRTVYQYLNEVEATPKL